MENVENVQYSDDWLCTAWVWLYIYFAEKIGDAEVLEVHVAAQDHVRDPPPQHTESE